MTTRASLEELLLDFEDYLRHHRLQQWTPNSVEASAVRSVPRRFRQDRSDPSDLTDLTDPSDPGDLENALPCSRPLIVTPICHIKESQRYTLPIACPAFGRVPG